MHSINLTRTECPATAISIWFLYSLKTLKILLLGQQQQALVLCRVFINLFDIIVMFYFLNFRFTLFIHTYKYLLIKVPFR